MRKAYIIMDGQWGSCGKGLLAGYLAMYRQPDLIVTTYGPNAGHTVYDGGTPVVTRQIPSGAITWTSCPIVVGAGAVIDPWVLIEEVNKLHKYNIHERLVIHPRATVVSMAHKETEQTALKTIASTMKGTGAAIASKVMREDDCVADQCDMLTRWVKPVPLIDNLIERAKSIQVESSQGLELSLNHGTSYPTCTSRDITPEAIMNDAGIPMRFHRETCVAIRTFPIRVGNIVEDGVEVGYSGPVYPDMEELSWDEVSKIAGIPLLEKTTVTGRVRRVFTFSEQQYQSMLYRLSPCTIFINFVNYWNHEARSYQDLSEIQQRKIASLNLHADGWNSRVQWLGFGPKCEDVEDLNVWAG